MGYSLALHITSGDNHRLGRGILPVIIRLLVLRHHVSTGLDLGQYDLAIPVCGVEPVGTGQPLIVRYEFTIGVGDLEPRTGQGLLGHAVIFFDDQRPLGGIRDDDSLRVTVGADDYIGAGGVHHVTRRRFYLSQHQRAGCEVGYPNLTVAVGGEQTVLGEGTAADHAVQAHLTARCCGQAELCAREGLAGNTVPFLNNQGTLGLVLEPCVDKKDTARNRQNKI